MTERLRWAIGSAVVTAALVLVAALVSQCSPPWAKAEADRLRAETELAKARADSIRLEADSIRALVPDSAARAARDSAILARGVEQGREAARMAQRGIQSAAAGADSLVDALELAGLDPWVPTVRRLEALPAEVAAAKDEEYRPQLEARDTVIARQRIDIRLLELADDRHATAYDSLERAFDARGAEVAFYREAAIRANRVNIFGIRVPKWLSHLAAGTAGFYVGSRTSG